MQNNSLREENMRLKTRLAQMETETDDRGSSTLLSGLRQTIKDLRVYVRKKDEEVAVLKRNMKNSRVKELEVELETYQEECGRLSKLVADSKLHHQAQLRHDDLEDRLRLELSSNSNLRQEVKQLSAVLQDTKDLHEQDQLLIQQLERKLKPKKSQEHIQMLTLEVQKLKSQLMDEENAKNQLEIRIKEQIERLEKAQAADNQKETEITALKRELTEKSGQIKTLEAQNQSVRKSMNSATRTIRDLEQTKAGLEEQVSQLAKDLAARQADLQQAQTDKLALIQADAAVLESKQEAWDIDKAGLETEIAEKQQELESAQIAISQKEAEIEALRSEHSAASAALNRQIGDLQLLTETLLRRAEDSESRENQLQSQLSQLQTHIKATEITERSLRESLETSEKEQERLNGQVAELRADLTSAQHRVYTEQTSGREMMEMLRVEQQQREGLLLRIVKALGKKTANVRKHCEDIPALMRDLDEKNTGLAPLKPVKKALKKLHLKKFAFKVVQALVETDSGEIKLKDLQKILLKPVSADSSASSKSASPRTSEVAEFRQELPVAIWQEAKPQDKPEEVEINYEEEKEEETRREDLEPGKEEEARKEDLEPDREEQGEQTDTAFSPHFPGESEQKAEIPQEPEESYSSEKYSFEEVQGEETPSQPVPAQLPPASTAESEPLLSSLSILLRHLSFRLQLHRFTPDQLSKQLSSNEPQVSCSALRLHFSMSPLSVTDRKDQQLLLLVCLEQLLTEENMERNWEGSVEMEGVMRALMRRLGTWIVFRKEDEDEMDAKITEAMMDKGVTFKSFCLQIDREGRGYITNIDFLSILQELGISFDPLCLQYLQLLFYSQDHQLDKVPYETFIGAYIALDSDPEPSLPAPSLPALSHAIEETPSQLTEGQRVSLIRQQVTAIAARLGSRKLSEVFIPSADRLIFPQQFKAGINLLGVQMSAETLEVVLEGLQYESSSQPCISLVELEEIVAKHRPEPAANSEAEESDQSELEYEGEEEDRM